MNKEVLTRCGYRCDLCLAYKPNIEAHPENRQILSDGWHRYFGFRIPAEKIYCEGCMEENPQLIDQACPVRPCVIARGLMSCSECRDFGCDKLKERLVDFAEMEKKAGHPIPIEDRQRFIAPYENKKRLDDLRAKKAG